MLCCNKTCSFLCKTATFTCRNPLGSNRGRLCTQNFRHISLSLKFEYMCSHFFIKTPKSCSQFTIVLGQMFILFFGLVGPRTVGPITFGCFKLFDIFYFLNMINIGVQIFKQRKTIKHIGLLFARLNSVSHGTELHLVTDLGMTHSEALICVFWFYFFSAKMGLFWNTLQVTSVYLFRV